MKHWLVFLCLVATSCAPSINLKNDKYEKQARLEIDEAPHAKNSLEWWYYTGLLYDEETKDSFGIEFVIFHFCIDGKTDRMLTNVAITDVKNKEFYYSHALQKVDAPSTELPLDLLVENKNTKSHLKGGLGNYELFTEANLKDDPFGYNLKLSTELPALMHGNKTGYEKYGDAAVAGYYSYTEITAKGTLTINGEERKVSGDLWYDRQWNCGAVMTQPGAGWDWMSITLDQTQEQLMLYRLRTADGNEILGGTILNPDGTSEAIPSQEIKLTTTAEFESEKSKGTYPTALHVSIPKHKIELDVKSVFPDQELEIKILPFLKMHYWEGLCNVTGTSNGTKVSGASYLEITNPQNKKH